MAITWLDSLVVFADVGDVVRAAPAETLSLTLTGPCAAALPAGAENLVLRAAARLAEAAGVRAAARLTLEKHLPVASGIGGGSADAAAALRLLARLWRLALPPDAMRRLALSLGADVPVCLDARPARMGGIGEVLTRAPDLPPFGMVLVNPGVAVATPAVFGGAAAGVLAAARPAAGWPDAAAMARDLARAGNDLEAPAIALAPADRRGARGAGGVAGMPAGAHERLGRHLLRPVRRPLRRPGGPPTGWRGPAGGAGAAGLSAAAGAAY